MARTARDKEFESPVNIENIDPSVCRMIGGKVGKDGKCRVKMKVSTEHPKQVEMQSLEDDDVLRD